MNASMKAELETLASAANGLLHAEQVIEFAKNPETALHREFEWDDTEAAAKYRLQQARQVIRVFVKFEPRVNRECRALVSVPSDRSISGGYRKTSEVLDSPNYRVQVVEEALKRIEATRDNFNYLPELDPLFTRLSNMIAEFRKEMAGSQQAAG